MKHFKSIEEMALYSAQAVRPPERLNVAEAATKYRWLNNPGSYVGPWKHEKTPYLVEPMETLTSLNFTAMIFAGPARTGKSDVFFNWLAYTAMCDPADMMMIHMTQNSARQWSQAELQRMLRATSCVGDKVAPGKQNLNVHDVRFAAGWRLLVSWPTISELSGKTIPRLWLNDYDRMDPSIGGEGAPFDLARKRAQTFKRFGMTVAESSPGRDVSDPRWMRNPRFPHEAPPVGSDRDGGGIMALYNRGDRRRWYWRCPQCNEPFEGDFEHLKWETRADLMEAAESVVLVCPTHGCVIEPKEQFNLNLGGKWLREGERWEADGSVSGAPRRSDIASFWLKGTAAAFTTWPNLVFKYLQAISEYEQNGSEEALRGTVTLDQGVPYVPRASQLARLPETLKERAEDWGGVKDAPVVPKGVRFLIATVDVQSRAFVVQVHGFGPGGDIWIVDTRKIRKSKRMDQDNHPMPVDPASYPEDWDLLIEEVMTRTYPLSDGSGRLMQIKQTACDSGGRDGVTTNAYAFYRRLREMGGEYAARFHLVKGQASNSAPRVQLTYPDSKQTGVNAVARGDVPVYLLNSNLLKDQVSGMLGRDDEGKLQVGGKVHFPIWAEDWLYKQLTSEIRTTKGWENKANTRNEAWDLIYYALGIAVYPPIRVEKLNWSDPPGWASEWDKNDLVMLPGAKPFASQHEVEYDLEALAKELG